MSAAVVCQRALHVGPDQQLAVLGMIDDGGAVYLEILTLRRPVSSVDPQDFHGTGEPPRLPLHLAEIFAENVAKVALRTAEAALVAPVEDRK